MVTKYSTTTTTWDQYLGWDMNYVKDTILEKYKGQINTVEIYYPWYPSSALPTDYRNDRIILFTDNRGYVEKIEQR